MITFTVIAFNDVPADGTLQAQFDELGGSIGRAETNQLVLPDPERMVSRVAAQVVYRNGSYAIIDRGSNPINLNGRPLSSGREAPLGDGDRVRICGYELSVRIGSSRPAVPDDPFSDLLGPAPAPARGIAPATPIDPLAIRGAPAAPAAPARAAAGGIPEDWDPFAAPATGTGAAKPGATPQRRDALGLDLGAAAPAGLIPGEIPSAAPSSLDQLFGLGPASGGDPLAHTPLDAPLAQPNMSGDADPLRALNSAPRGSAPSETDAFSDLNRPFIPPTVITPPTPREAPPPIAGAVMSWEDDRSAQQTELRIKAARPAASPPSPVSPVPQRSPSIAPAAPGVPTVPGAPMGPFASPASVAARPAPIDVEIPAGPGQQADAASLLEALRRGLAVPTIDLPALTPALMELIGQLLHEAVRGTVDLLNARAAIKHELRADVTTIVARNNNPLKFSPNAEVALQHLLAPPARGFIAALPAMRDAYDDLRAHQFGIVAGTQAVLEAALQRFDPAALESRLGDRSLLQSLLPASRSARLWELFTEHYARIRKDASDDFHTLFGHAFVKAYEEQVDRLQEWSPPKRPEG